MIKKVKIPNTFIVYLQKNRQLTEMLDTVRYFERLDIFETKYRAKEIFTHLLKIMITDKVLRWSRKAKF